MTGASETCPASELEEHDGCCASIATKCHSRVTELKEFTTELLHLGRQLNVKQTAGQLFTFDALKNRLPVLKWIPKYR